MISKNGAGGGSRHGSPEWWWAGTPQHYGARVATGDPATIECAPGDHVCWVYGSEDDFLATAASFLEDGLRRGEAILYVGDGEELGASLPTLEVERAHDRYSAPDTDPAPQVEGYRRLTEEALAAGKTGLRVAADVTSIVTGEAARTPFMAYEIAVDRYISRAPMTALCAYDAAALGDAASDFACVHRRRRAPDGAADPGFSLYPAGERFNVTGEVDASNADRLARALEAAAIASADADVQLDLGELSFIDLKGVQVLAEFARAFPPGRSIEIDDARGLVTTVSRSVGWDDLLDHIRSS
jgi:hypothetical protein